MTFKPLEIAFRYSKPPTYYALDWFVSTQQSFVPGASNKHERQVYIAGWCSQYIGPFKLVILEGLS